MRPGAPRVDRTQSETLQRRRERLQAAGGVMQVLRRHVDGEPARDATCTLQDESPDRFVLRVDVERRGDVRATYAFKVYADDRAARLWGIARAIHAQHPRGCPLCLPLAYVPELGLTISPWVHGTSLRSAIRNGDASLVAHAATQAPSLLAWIHRARMPREAPRTAQAVAARTHHRCIKLARWPQTKMLSRTLLAALDKALPRLERSPATFVHGDPGPANMLFDGRRWVLIDLDRCGCADPAYDVGYLLAQLTRRCLERPALAVRAPQSAAVLEAGYRAAMPQVPGRNIAFYYAVTLMQKLHMTWRERPADALAAIEPLALRALRALEQVQEG